MSTNYIAPIWRMPENTNNVDNKLSNYSLDFQSGGSSGRHISCGTDLFTSGSIPSISISAWIKTTTGSANAIMSKDLTTLGNRIFLFQLASGDLYWQTSGDGNNFSSLILPQSTYDVLDGNWHHIVVTYNSGSSSADGEKKIYVDGQERIADPAATFVPLYNNPSVSLEIGRRGDGNRYFSDNMSQVCLFEYALNSTQVTYLYNLNNPMVITPREPLAYWPLGDNGNPHSPGSFPNISVGADSVFDFIPNDYINVPDNDSLSFGDASNDSPFSISAWVYFDTTSTNMGIIGKYGTSDTRREWLLYIAGATLRLYLKDGSAYRIRIGTTTIQANNWYHLASTYDGRGGDDAEQGVQLYINGQPETMTSLTSGTYVAMHNTVEPVNIGRFSGTAYLDGRETNVQVWSTKLTGPEVLTLYNNGQPLMTGTQPQESSLVAWWKLNQSANWTGSAWSIPDDSTNTNTGTSNGMDTTNLVQSNLTRTQPYSNYSFNLDSGSSDFFEITTTPSAVVCNGESARTFSGWINADSFSEQDGIFQRRLDNNNRFLIKLTRSSGVSPFYNGIMVQVVNGGTNGFSEWRSILDANEWYHIAVIYDGPQGAQADRIKLYLNGVDAGTRNAGFGTIPNTMPTISDVTPIRLAVDNSASGRYWNGKFSNFAMFNRVLTAAEIFEIYNNGIPQDLDTLSFSSDMLAWWPMDANNSYFEGNNWIIRELVGGRDGDGYNTGNYNDLKGNAPGVVGSGVGSNFVIEYLEGNMYNSDANSYSINMGDYADGVTNPADSGRSTNVP